MSDPIKHECGLAFIRLRKSFSYYQQQYGTALYGLNKLYLLMEKQHNRGQDGAGIATVKLNVEPGYPFMFRNRSNAAQPIAQLFKQIGEELAEIEKYQPNITQHPGLLKGHLRFLGENMLGHLRYGTQGKNDVNFCHPFVKHDTIPSRNLALAGNFNLVNTEELFQHINFDAGSFAKQSDLAAMMEVIHHYLVESDKNSQTKLDVISALKKALPLFDGGFHIGGIIGDGTAFICRDAHGIRPSYYYINDEVIVAASERAAIRTAFNVGENEVLELMPGQGLIVDEQGNYTIQQILPAKERKACSFERIYFSRGSDEKIYKERIALGKALTMPILEKIDNNLKHTIFSFIPNTAEIAFLGLVKGMGNFLNQIKFERIKSWGKNYTDEQLDEMINRKVRIEKIAIKDVKLRTFITEDNTRNEMVQHVYDITYGTVAKDVDTLVVIDDSIVRGTTLRESIIRMLSRLSPTKIIVVSSAPQIRYPDCYGIDMSKMGEFVAFKAALALHIDNNTTHIIDEVAAEIKQLQQSNNLHTTNVVRKIYENFTAEQISNKVAQLITPENWPIPIEVIYQSIEKLHECCPNNLGDWYFTGNYPTPGGNKVCNMAFLNFYDGKNVRGY